MKNIILFVTLGLLLTTSALAKGGDMGGGVAMTLNTIALPTSEVEAFIANDGAYISVADIQAGFESIKGLEITPHKTLIDLTMITKIKIDSILMKSGREFQLEMKSDGGDMGGG